MHTHRNSMFQLFCCLHSFLFIHGIICLNNCYVIYLPRAGTDGLKCKGKSLIKKIILTLNGSECKHINSKCVHRVKYVETLMAKEQKTLSIRFRRRWMYGGNKGKAGKTSNRRHVQKYKVSLSFLCEFGPLPWNFIIHIEHFMKDTMHNCCFPQWQQANSGHHNYVYRRNAICR